MPGTRSGGGVVWFTGLSASGKSTLANEVAKNLSSQNISHEIIDGDEVRSFFENDLGYSREDRVCNVKRIAFAARVLAKHKVIVLVANIAPYDDLRRWVRNRIDNFCLVYLDLPLASCRARDTKGIYDSATNVIGRDEPYEPPADAEIVIQDGESLATSAERVAAFLRHSSWITS